MNGATAFCLAFIVLWLGLLTLVVITAHIVDKKSRRKQREKDNVSSAAIPWKTMKMTNTAEIAHELVTLDRALREMTSYDNEILRLRSREEPENGHHR